MSWSYSDSLSSDRDKLRFKIGDVDTNDQLLSNELLDALLTTRGDPTLAAINAVEGILAKFARGFRAWRFSLAENPVLP